MYREEDEKMLMTMWLREAMEKIFNKHKKKWKGCKILHGLVSEAEIIC